MLDTDNNTPINTAEDLAQTQRLINNIKDKIFDPRVLEKNGEALNKIWTSESVNLAMDGLRRGYKLSHNPFLPKSEDHRLRRANLPFKYSEEEIEILKMVYKDKILFADNFMHLKDGDKGWQKIKLRDYQKNLLKNYTDNRWNIVMFPRQSGKTTTTIVEILHYCISNYDKQCVVIAQSEDVVNEISGKIKSAFSALPFFMQPGFVNFTKKGFVLDNGCKLYLGVAKESVVQGFSIDFLFVDEFAYIPESYITKFWNNIYPALSNNPKSRCIIASTPNGRNKFYELWTNAKNKRNRFTINRIYWYDVPNRGEEFKNETIQNLGLEGWEMGYECSFDTQLKSIFGIKMQKELRQKQQEYEKLWCNDNCYLGKLHPDIKFIPQETHKYDIKNDFFLMSVDISEGLGQDYSTLKIKHAYLSEELDTNAKPLVRYENIGVFMSNEISVEDFAVLLMDICMEFNMSRIRIIIENNNYGGELLNQIKNMYNYEEKYANFEMTILCKFERSLSNSDKRMNLEKYEIGIRWNRENKKIGVKYYKDLMLKNIITDTHPESIEQCLNFGKASNDTYSAQYGNDDLVMADVSLSFFLCSKNSINRDFLEYMQNELINKKEYDAYLLEHPNDQHGENGSQSLSNDSTLIHEQRGWKVFTGEQPTNTPPKNNIYM